MTQHIITMLLVMVSSCSNCDYYIASYMLCFVMVWLAVVFEFNSVSSAGRKILIV